MQHTFKMPDAFVILLAIAGMCYAISYIAVPGQFIDMENASTVSLAQFVRAEGPLPVPIFGTDSDVGLVNILFEGLVSGDRNGAAIGVIAFILITGGAFGVLMQTKAIDNGILALIGSTTKIDWLFIPCLFITFALGGAIFGMGEEAIAFCIVLFPIMKKLGYNAQVTVLVTYVATQIGFAVSPMNPFSIAIAQSIAQLPVFSGAQYRTIIAAIFIVSGLVFTCRYAAQIRSNRSQEHNYRAQSLDITDKLLLAAFFMVISWVIYGVTIKGYYIAELASQFFVLAIVVAIIAKIGKRQSIDQSVTAFKKGSAELLPAALLVGLAKGLVILLGGGSLSELSLLNTLLFHAASVISNVPDIVAAWCMYLFQSIFNFFVSSGSGQAAITMPIMAPLADLLGVSRQTAVLAFQLGDGLTNIIIPTSASLIGCLGVVKLSWSEWANFIWRFMLFLFALASLCVITAHIINYQ